MSYHKTTAFYEMHIRKILEDYGGEISSRVKQNLFMMIQNPNREDFQRWLEDNNAEEYK